jgi:hypothetical protein
MTLLLVCPDPTDRAEVLRFIERQGLDVVLVDAVPRALDAGAFREIEEAIATHLPDPEPSMLGLFAPLLALGSRYPSMPGERNLFRRPERAPKPPAEIQAAIKAKADEKRAARCARRLAQVAR